MLDAKAREALDGLSRVTGNILGRLHISPNVFTVAGVGITGVAAWQILSGRLAIAGFVLIFGSVFDFFDGSVARATGKTSVFGAFLDSVTDRVSDGIVFATLFWWLLDAGDLDRALLALVTLVGSQLVSYVRAKAESLGFDCKVGLMERAERIIIVITALVLGTLWDVVLTVGLWALAVGSVLTFLQRMVHVYRQAASRTG